MQQNEMIKKIIRVAGYGDFEFPFMTADEVLSDEDCIEAVRAQVPNLPTNARISSWSDDGVDANGMHVYSANLSVRAQTKGC